MLHQNHRSIGIMSRLLFVVMAFQFGLPAHASQSQAQVVKKTAVKKMPKRSSANIGEVKAKEKISILKRQGGWYQIDTAKTPQGWVNMLSVRFNRAPYRSGKTGFGSVLSVVKGGHSNVTSTTGVRGFNEEDLVNSNADFLALSKMINFKVSAQNSRQFARQGKLKSRTVINMKESSDE